MVLAGTHLSLTVINICRCCPKCTEQFYPTRKPLRKHISLSIHVLWGTINRKGDISLSFCVTLWVITIKGTSSQIHTPIQIIVNYLLCCSWETSICKQLRHGKYKLFILHVDVRSYYVRNVMPYGNGVGCEGLSVMTHSSKKDTIWYSMLYKWLYTRRRPHPPIHS